MSGHMTDDRIHDYLDGLLGPAAERALEAHASVCDTCADRLGRIATTVEALRDLPVHGEPPRDLWPGVRERIESGAGSLSGAPGDGVDVIPFPVEATRSGWGSATGEGLERRRRVSLSVPQLAAASVAVALLSGSAVWLATGGSRASLGTATAAVEAPANAAVPGDVAPAATGTAPGAAFAADPGETVAAGPAEAGPGAPSDFRDAVAELEQVLFEGRALLHPETLRTLEESLATIDRAISEAEEALAADPGSELLHRLLVTQQRSKIRVLRQAAAGLLPSA